MEAQEPRNNQLAVVPEEEPLNPQPAEAPEAEPLPNAPEAEPLPNAPEAEPLPNAPEARKPILTRLTDALRRRVRSRIHLENVEKYVFKPPESRTYDIEFDDPLQKHTFVLYHRMDGISQEELSEIKVFSRINKFDSPVWTFYWEYPGATYTLFISHDSTVDVGSDLLFTKRLRNELKCSVFTYEYTGYGYTEGQTGKPSETNLYEDAKAAIYVLRHHYNVDDTRIIVFGQSVGTVPAIHVARDEYNFAGLILHSPFTSYMGSRHWYTLPFMDFEFLRCSGERIGRIACSTAVIHSKRDNVLSYRSAKKMADKAPNLRNMIKSTSEHNVLSDKDIEKLKKFIPHKLGHWVPLPKKPTQIGMY